jgi:intraflagellar transport protein 172
LEATIGILKLINEIFLNSNKIVIKILTKLRIRIYNWSPRKGLFEESDPKEFTNLYTITSISWKKDGSRLALGNLTGCVDLYDCSLKKQLYKGKFEMTYVGLSQV